MTANKSPMSTAIGGGDGDANANPIAGDCDDGVSRDLDPDALYHGIANATGDDDRDDANENASAIGFHVDVSLIDYVNANGNAATRKAEFFHFQNP